MKKLLLLIWALPLLVLGQTKVCLVSASAEYSSHDSLAKLQTDLEKEGMVCFRAFGEDKGNGIPGLEKLAESDVLVLFTRRVNLPPEQLEILRKHVDAGKAVIGIRTASHGIQNWQPDVKALDKDVFGGSYDGHYKNDEAAELSRAAGQEGHAIFKDVAPFETDGKLYKNEKLAADVTVLMTAKNISGQSQPVVWTRTHNGGKIFYTSLGVQSDFTKPEFRKLLVNAVAWSAAK